MECLAILRKLPENRLSKSAPEPFGVAIVGSYLLDVPRARSYIHGTKECL